jgi:predicted aminopeptidase
VRTAHDRLTEIYASSASDEEKQKEKLATFAAMNADYERIKAGEPGLAGYDRWFAQHPNNASLAAIAIYTDRVPAFRVLLAESGNDLSRFYERVRTLAALPKGERDAVLTAAAARSIEAIGAAGSPN